MYGHVTDRFWSLVKDFSAIAVTKNDDVSLENWPKSVKPIFNLFVLFPGCTVCPEITSKRYFLGRNGTNEREQETSILFQIKWKAYQNTFDFYCTITADQDSSPVFRFRMTVTESRGVYGIYSYIPKLIWEPARHVIILTVIRNRSYKHRGGYDIYASEVYDAAVHNSPTGVSGVLVATPVVVIDSRLLKLPRSATNQSISTLSCMVKLPGLAHESGRG